jgi:glucose 1-dehydrogenase
METVFISDNREKTAVCAAEYLAGNGYHVIINDLGGEIAAGCASVSLDLTDFERLSGFLSGIGHLHGVIIPAPPQRRISIEEAGDPDWDEGMREGALSSIILTHAAGEIMSKNGCGSLIYLGSIHAEKPTGCSFIYSTACSAVQMLCREAALDYGSMGVNCFYIQRGIMEHDLYHKSKYSNIYSRPECRYPKKRIPPPDSLNGLIYFLLSDNAAPLNGSDLRADEGYVMYYGNHPDRITGGKKRDRH